MTHKRRYTMRARRSPGEALLRLLMARGGSASLSQISRATATGKLLADAKPEVAGLIETEQSRGKGSKRPVTRVSLTLAGLAAAQAIRPDWTPRRLAVDVLKAWLDELGQERNPWALDLLRDHDDALQWRAHEQQMKRHEIVCGAPKPKARPRGRPFVAQGVHGSVPSEQPTSHHANNHVPNKPDAAPEALPPTSHCRRCGHCERCHFSSDICPCGSFHACGRSAPAYSPSKMRTEPTAQDAPSDGSLSAKIKDAGFQVRADGMVKHGGTWITAGYWMEKEGWRLR